MADHEKLEDVTVFEVEIEGRAYSLMAYEIDGEQLITFAAEDEHGLCTFAPFPEHMLDCDECMATMAARMNELGYTLVMVSEQQVKPC